MLIQCTKKLLDALKIKPEQAPDEEPLFSWHANLLVINRRKTLVLMNDSSRYLVVFHGLKAKDFKNLNTRIIDTIRETLLADLIKPEIVERFLKHSSEIGYAKTKNRTMVARLNKSCERVWAYSDELNPETIIQTPISKRVNASLVGDGKGDYILPNELMYQELETFAKEPLFSCQAVTFKATLVLEHHKIWRRAILPLSITFRQLHAVLQTLFDWQNYHLHDFYIYDGKKPVVNLVCSEDAFDEPNDVPMIMETDKKLSDYVPKYSELKYTYDFGDDWEHFIEIESISENYPNNYPICLEGEGTAPPEDVGGEGGYDEFLEAMANPEHPEHKSMVEWSQMQLYLDFNLENVNRELKELR